MGKLWCQISEVHREVSLNAWGSIPGDGPVESNSKVALIEKNQNLRRRAVDLLLEIVELREQLLQPEQPTRSHRGI